VEAEHVAAAEEERAEAERPPALAADRQLERAWLAGPEPERAQVASAGRELVGQRQQQLQAVDSQRRRELDRGDRLVALERPLPVERERRLDSGLAPERRPGERRERKRCRQRDQLNPSRGQPGDQPECGEARVAA